MMRRGAKRLQQQLARNHDIAGRFAADSFPVETLDCLQVFQRERLSRSFADLVDDPDYAPACRFFLAELYGGLGFRQRDQDIQRVLHVMRRFLPDRVLYSMSEAFELQAVSLEQDEAMVRTMVSEGLRKLDVRSYGHVYRMASDRDQRERQILLIGQLGRDMVPLVRKPMVNALVRLMHKPAHAAGFGQLQDFLEDGLDAFRTLKDVHYFLDTIHDREWAVMQKLFAGDPEPFVFS